jgi:hypothetical protein
MTIYYSENELKNKLVMQNLNLWINSYGGSGTNWLQKNLSQKYNVSTPIWSIKLCHYIQPINEIPIQFGIYIYADPLYALVSELRRDLLHMNFFRMMPMKYKGIKYSIRQMVEKMEEQMDCWRNAKVNYPIILIKYEKIEENLDKIQKTLDTEFKYELKKRKTDKKMIEFYQNKYNLEKIEDTIQSARNKYNEMPDFEIIYPST